MAAKTGAAHGSHKKTARPSWRWQNEALCWGVDLVLFFGPEGERQPERDIRERKAKAICAQCPVCPACLDYALGVPEKAGTWGGLNEDERAAERRRRSRRAASGRPVEDIPLPDVEDLASEEAS